jgi:hypothetical protein
VNEFAASEQAKPKVRVSLPYSVIKTKIMTLYSTDSTAKNAKLAKQRYPNCLAGVLRVLGRSIQIKL